VKLSNLSKQEIRFYEEMINFTNDEELVLEMSSKGKSRIEMSDRLGVSVPTIDRIIKKIKRKVESHNAYSQNLHENGS